MNKKLLLTIGSLSVVTLPMATLVSCSLPSTSSEAIVTEINNVHEALSDKVKENKLEEIDNKYYFSSTKSDSEISAAITEAKNENENFIRGKDTIESTLGINAGFTGVDVKETTITWVSTRSQSPTGATYTIIITVAKSSAKTKTVELWVRSADYSTTNIDTNAVEDVKYKLTTHINGTYRSTLNATELTALISDSDGLTVNDLAIDSNTSSFYDAKAFYNIQSGDLVSNGVTTTLKFEIKNVGATIVETGGNQTGSKSGNAERKAFTVYGVISSSNNVNIKDTFAFTLNSAYYTAEEKLEAEHDRFISNVANIGTTDAPIYTMGSTNIDNREILPTTFVDPTAGANFEANKTKEKIGFDDSRRIYGTKYSFDFPTANAANDEDGTVKVIIQIEVLNDDGTVNSAVSAKTETVIFKNFQNKLGAQTAINHTISNMATKLYEVQRHNDKVIKGKIVSFGETKLTKLPSEIYKNSFPFRPGIDDDDQTPDVDESRPGSDGSFDEQSELKAIIPASISDFTDPLCDISFSTNEINTDDLRGELGIDVKLSYKNSKEISDSFILLLTGFKTVQDEVMNSIDTSEINVGSIKLSEVAPVDGQIVQDPQGSGASVDQHKALYNILKSSLRTKDGGFLTTISFGEYDQYYQGFQILTSTWTGSTRRIKIKLIVRRDGIEYSATTSEINLVSN